MSGARLDADNQLELRVHVCEYGVAPSSDRRRVAILHGNLLEAKVQKVLELTLHAMAIQKLHIY